MNKMKVKLNDKLVNKYFQFNPKIRSFCNLFIESQCSM